MICRAQGRDGYDDEDSDDEEPPSVNVANFRPPSSATIMSYGLFKGRSSPSQRKAMGTSGSSVAKIHICTNCGSEFVKYFGRCPTCKEWNTLQEHVVTRQSSSPFSSASSNPFAFPPAMSTSQQPVFAASSSSSSWLDGIYDQGGSGGPSSLSNVPIRITDLYDTPPNGSNDTSSPHSKVSTRPSSSKRIVIPNDPELNMVLGGGLMKGSLLLVGGDPGVGKSTLLLQTAASIASLVTPPPKIGMGGFDTDDSSLTLSGPVWYVSGEESPDQIASRASRLGIYESELYLLGETQVGRLCEQVATLLWQSLSPERKPSTRRATNNGDSHHDSDDDETTEDDEIPVWLRPKPPSLLVIDSIQTMVCGMSSSSAGSITQVRDCVSMLLRLCKSTNIPIVLVGHVTKSGDVAGPRTIEHMVDAVLYLEGGSHSASSSGSMMSNVRMLRASKNRFGSTEEVGMYEMTSGKLLPVSDPSSLFMAHRMNEDDDVEGCAIAISLEGRRAVAIEVQALVTPATNAPSGYGRKTVDGLSYSRLNLLLGVLQKRCKLYVSRHDIYINIIGNVRLDRGDSNGDLAIVLALVSSLVSIPVRSDTAFVGEIGLLGELRPMSNLSKRLAEARRMGFSRIVTPREVTPKSGSSSYSSKKGRKDVKNLRARSSMINGIEWIQCELLQDAINVGLVSPLPQRTNRRKRVASSDETEMESPSRLYELQLDEIMDDDDDDEPFL